MGKKKKKRRKWHKTDTVVVAAQLPCEPEIIITDVLCCYRGRPESYVLYNVSAEPDAHHNDVFVRASPATEEVAS